MACDERKCWNDVNSKISEVQGKLKQLIVEDMNQLQQALEQACKNLSDGEAQSIAASTAKDAGDILSRIGPGLARAAGGNWRDIVSCCGNVRDKLLLWIKGKILGDPNNPQAKTGAATATLNICSQLKTLSGSCNLNAEDCNEIALSSFGYANPNDCVKELGYTRDGNIDDKTGMLNENAQKALCVLCKGLEILDYEKEDPSSACSGSAKIILKCGLFEFDTIEIEWKGPIEEKIAWDTAAEKLLGVWKKQITEALQVIRSIVTTAIANQNKLISNLQKTVTAIGSQKGDLAQIFLLAYLSGCNGCLKVPEMIAANTPNDDCVDKIREKCVPGLPEEKKPIGKYQVCGPDAVNAGIDMDNPDNPANFIAALNIIKGLTPGKVQCDNAKILSVTIEGGCANIIYNFCPSAMWSSTLGDIEGCNIADNAEKMKRIVDALNASRTPCGGPSPFYSIVLGYFPGSNNQPIGFGSTATEKQACEHTWPNAHDNPDRFGPQQTDPLPVDCRVYPHVYTRTQREDFTLDIYLITQIWPKVYKPNRNMLAGFLGRAGALIRSVDGCKAK